MALTSDLLVSKSTINVERDSLPEVLNRYETKTKQSKMSILDEDAAMKAINTGFLERKRKVAPIETEKGLLMTSNAKLL